MLGCGVVGGLRLHQRGLGGVQIAAGNRAFREELLAAVHDAGVQVEIGLGLREIEFGLLHIFRNLRFGCGGIGCLRGFVGTLVVLRGGGEVAVLKHGEQLAFFHLRSALHVELLHRRADLGLDGGLRQRRKDGVGGDVLGDRALLGMLGLHGDFRRGRLFLFAARQAGCNGQQRTTRQCSIQRCVSIMRRVLIVRCKSRFVHGFTSFPSGFAMPASAAS